MRELIENGHVYIATPPLYLVKKGKEQKYAWSEEQRIQYVAEASKGGSESGVHVQRYKGLGEMNPEQLWETTMDPATRTVLQVNVQDAIEADHIFSVLMGDQVEPRRKFIEDNAHMVRNLDL